MRWIRLRNSRLTTPFLFLLCAAVAAGVLGCQSPGRTDTDSREKAAERPAATSADADRDLHRDEGTDPRDRETAERVTTRPSTQPAVRSDDTPARDEHRPPQAKLPDYLHVTRRFEINRPIRVTATIQGDRRLIIESENVQRIKIDRAQIPLRRDRSIILQLDGQPIEWMVKSEVTEFERTSTGIWVDVPPAGKR